ncbi:MAG: PAS domain S-box protein, partial [Gammaproteobacteria bacterium]|nr:PAS domain S-box protein [Gammaproteobacteria bacterium]
VRLRLVPERDGSGSIVSVLGIGEDVTERVRVTSALHDSEQRLNFALDKTQTGLWDFFPQSGRLVLSDSYYTMLGYQPGAFPATYEDGWKALVHQNDKGRAVAAFESFAGPSGQRSSYAVQFRMRSRDGEWRWINSRGTAVERDSDGRAVRVVGVHLDITAQRMAEAEQRFRTDVLEHALNGFSIVDGDGHFLYANRAHLALWGYERLDEIVGTSPASHCVDPDMASRIKMVLRARNEGTFEFKARRRDGSTFDVMMACKRYIDQDGRELFTGSSIDISDRIRAGAVIRETQERLLSWTAATSSILWWADARLELAPPQPSFQAVTGFTAQRLDNGGWVEALHPDDRREVLSRRLGSADSGELYECEARIWHAPSQRYRWYLERGVPRREDSGAVLGWAGISIDIQRQKEAESALQEADRRKDEFLAMLGHELRNPLAAISTVGEIVCRHAQLSAPLASAGEILTRQTAHLGRLVDDLLDVSRLLHGKVALRCESVNVAELAQQIADDQQPQLALRRQKLMLTRPAEPVVVDGDPVRLAQILENLLSNAGKYSPDGGEIRLLISSGPGFAQIRVQDDGAGIPD